LIKDKTYEIDIYKKGFSEVAINVFKMMCWHAIVSLYCRLVHVSGY